MRLLIIGDLEGQIGAATRIARASGASVTQVADTESALVSLRGGQGADLIMAEARMDIGGLIQALQAERLSVPVVACGVDSDSQVAVRAIKSGAKEYIPLPPDEELIAAVLRAITEDSTSLIYHSNAMAGVVQMASQVATSDASILITGESGTGKEVLARHVWKKSKRAAAPFISVNCAAIPETLLESELFGYEKGAFTGAVSRRIGKFEEASNGTLLLDEISEMDIRLQAKLLRAIQEQEIDRIGGSKPIKINIRILATSNRNLQQEVKQGRFREDLYFRLNVISLQIPPLRERKEDIAAIATHFSGKYAQSNGVPVRPITPQALAKLQSYNWPGNVRELENIVHRAVLLATGNTIDEAAIMLPTLDAAKPSGTGEGGSMVGRTVAEVERDLIINTLDHCLGNRTHAANILGISIRTLRNKLREYSESTGQKFGT